MLLADPPVNESGAASRDLEVGGWYVSADRIRRARGGPMPRLEVQIPAPDGTCPGTLHVPDGDGHPEPWFPTSTAGRARGPPSTWPRCSATPVSAAGWEPWCARSATTGSSPTPPP